MANDLEKRSSSSPSLAKKGIALVILLVAAYVLFVVIKGILLAIAIPLLVIAALVGIWWAWRTLR
jgi:Flp pilus assembly protein TadB